MLHQLTFGGQAVAGVQRFGDDRALDRFDDHIGQLLALAFGLSISLFFIFMRINRI
jgi:hypothetical protein